MDSDSDSDSDSGIKVELKGPKGPKALNLAGRIATMALAVASAALMTTASQCHVVLPNGTPAQTDTYSDFGPFVYLVVANATAALLSGVAIFLSVWKKKKGGAKYYSKVILPLLDTATPALLYSVTGAAFVAQDSMYAPQGRCVSVRDRAGRGGTRKFSSQVHMSTIISLAASFASSSAEVIQKVPLSLSLNLEDGSEKESDSGCPTGCAHGCRHKH